jgi:RNA 3'-terminal phosphate cyclase (ATP)
VELIALDGAQGEGGGQILRTALTVAAATGQGFRIERIRASRPRPGLRPQHVAAVRAAGMCCGAEVHGAFDGSPDVRFVPGDVAAGEFTFDIGTAGAVTLVLQTVIPVLAAATSESRLEITGGTHVPWSPSFHFLARHWTALTRRLGLSPVLLLEQAGFHPRGGGRVRATVRPWDRKEAPLDLSRRGALVAVRGVSGSARLRGDVARRAAEAARSLLWEKRRLASDWDVVEVKASSPGSFLQIEAVFEEGAAAFAYLGQRGLGPEVLGERATRRLLSFADQDDAVVDPWVADQLAVPMALSGGGRLLTSEVTTHLETVADTLRRFGFPAQTWGRHGGPGGLEVGRR